MTILVTSELTFTFVENKFELKWEYLESDKEKHIEIIDSDNLKRWLIRPGSFFASFNMDRGFVHLNNPLREKFAFISNNKTLNSFLLFQRVDDVEKKPRIVFVNGKTLLVGESKIIF